MDEQEIASTEVSRVYTGFKQPFLSFKEAIIDRIRTAWHRDVKWDVSSFEHISHAWRTRCMAYCKHFELKSKCKILFICLI